MTLAQRRARVAAAVAALQGISQVIHQTPNGELASLVGEFDQLRALADAGLVVVTAEAEKRGVIAESPCASTTAWVRDAAWHLQAGGSAAIAKCAGILRRHDLAVLADAIRTADVTPNVAATVASEFDTISPDLAAGLGPIVLEAMINMGADHGPSAVKQLRQELVARYGREGAFQAEQDAKRRYVDLDRGREESGVFHYELAVDAEGRAVLEAAIGPLSKPQPGPAPNSEPDPRWAGQRRGQALVEVCRRATAAGAQIPTTTKAALYVTMTPKDLIHCTGSGTTIGSLDGGAILAPETVRKLACDASVIPIVLGSNSEVLDVGMTQRLFTSAQLTALWLRDKHCTFPGCEAPAHWADAHHLKHWLDGRLTD
ncbi:MAG: 13E12 repeat family protein, partial [Actinomycetota bacterium]|nr:13E12 repeat family protein [Actinomycetota bacterium]